MSRSSCERVDDIRRFLVVVDVSVRDGVLHVGMVGLARLSLIEISDVEIVTLISIQLSILFIRGNMQILARAPLRNFVQRQRLARHRLLS